MSCAFCKVNSVSNYGGCPVGINFLGSHQRTFSKVQVRGGMTYEKSQLKHIYSYFFKKLSPMICFSPDLVCRSQLNSKVCSAHI